MALAHDTALINDIYEYIQMSEMQTPATQFAFDYHQFDFQPSVVPQPYELALGVPCDPIGFGVLGTGCSDGHLARMPILQHHHESRKRKTTQNIYDVVSDSVSLSSASTGTGSRRRKRSPYSGSSTFDDDLTDDSRSNRSLPDKRQNHSEIEKRRRDKMNTYITELSSMIPMCSAMTRKLDKLTVLRMAVQYIRSVRGAQVAGPLSSHPRPAFLSERDVNALVLQAAEDCFVMVVGCDRGRLLYLSASVTNLLHYDQNDLLGQSLFDFLHPKDVAKVKEQLSSSDLSPRERLIDVKTMLPLKADMMTGASRLCPGARRSFFCRIKTRVYDSSAPVVTSIRDELEAKPKKKQPEKKYCVIQCTGYLKSWAPMEMYETGDGALDDELGSLSCLVAVGRPLQGQAPRASPAPPAQMLQYTSRHSNDGKFLFVDQRMTLALGFLPQEFLGTSLYEHVNAEDLTAVSKAHKRALLKREVSKTPPYGVKRKDGSYARIVTQFKPFKNPWTKDIEYLIAKHTVVADEWLDETAAEDPYDLYSNGGPFCDDFDSRLSEADMEMQRLIDSQVESQKIGANIAEEMLRRPSEEYSPDLTEDMLQDALLNQPPILPDNLLETELGGYDNQVRHNVPLSAVGGQISPLPEIGDLSCTPPPSSPPVPPIDGNGEAAMAVIMSLLEADAGLGGPVNISGLPWPLP